MSLSPARRWFERNGALVQAGVSVLSLLIAVGALVGVKMQIDASARLQQEQSARDIYREYLNLSIGKPEFADPDICAIKAAGQETAYRNYVDYLLYTSEQMMTASPEWEGAMAEHLEPHGAYLCAVADWSDYPDAVGELVVRNKRRLCAAPMPTC